MFDLTLAPPEQLVLDIKIQACDVQGLTFLGHHHACLRGHAYRCNVQCKLSQFAQPKFEGLSVILHLQSTATCNIMCVMLFVRLCS